jgi:hypothetical protein
MKDRLLLALPHRQFVFTFPKILKSIVLEGGFDQRGKFVHIPLGDIHRMSEYFRRVVIRLFLKNELINAHLATSLINWKHSGFSVATIPSAFQPSLTKPAKPCPNISPDPLYP